MDGTEPLLSLGEAARRSGISRRTLARLCHEGEIGHVTIPAKGRKLRRIPVQVLDAYVARRTYVPASPAAGSAA